MPMLSPAWAAGHLSTLNCGAIPMTAFHAAAVAIDSPRHGGAWRQRILTHSVAAHAGKQPQPADWC
eukprot:7757679-Pyramimonas_sp.AAC.1